MSVSASALAFIPSEPEIPIHESECGLERLIDYQ